MKKVNITVLFTADVEDDTDIENLYINVDTDCVEILQDERLVANPNGYETVQTEEFIFESEDS